MPGCSWVERKTFHRAAVVLPERNAPSRSMRRVVSSMNAATAPRNRIVTVAISRTLDDELHALRAVIAQTEGDILWGFAESALEEHPRGDEPRPDIGFRLFVLPERDAHQEGHQPLPIGPALSSDTIRERGAGARASLPIPVPFRSSLETHSSGAVFLAPYRSTTHDSAASGQASRSVLSLPRRYGTVNHGMWVRWRSPARWGRCKNSSAASHSTSVSSGVRRSTAWAV